MAVTRRAVHIGAGKIGRGFVGQFLVASGYELTFVDVDERVLIPRCRGFPADY